MSCLQVESGVGGGDSPDQWTEVSWTPLLFAASPCEDSSFEDLTEESRKLGWANMGNLTPVHRHRIHKE